MFICVDTFVDGNRVCGNGTFMRISTEATCNDVLVEFMGLRAPEYCPLLDSTTVIMVCVKISDTVLGKPASDVGSRQDCSIFLYYPISMARYPRRDSRSNVVALLKIVNPVKICR